MQTPRSCPAVLRLFSLLSIVAVLATPPRAQQTYEAKPLPAGPEAYTWPQVFADRQQFWLSLLEAASPPASDSAEDAAEARRNLLDCYAAVLAGKQLSPASQTRLQAAAQRLRDAGDDNAWLRLAVAVALQQEGRLDAARPHFRKAADLAAASSEDDWLQYLLHSSLAHFHTADREPDDAATATALARTHLLALVNDARFADGIGPRIYLALFQRLLGGQVTANDGAIIERLTKRVAAPNFAVLTLRAEYHGALAWLARGKGTVDTIGRADRERFRRELTTALDLAEAAHQAGPQFPEAAIQMIRLLGTCGETEELRRWLDLAVAAQFDITTPYDFYLHYQQPRWGGSHQEQWSFGMECLATKRFDTLVPERFRTAVRQIAKDLRDPLAYWARQDVQAGLAELDAGYLAVAASPADRLRVQTRRMVSLVLAGKAAEAAGLYEEEGQRIEASALAVYDVSEEWLLRALRPHLADFEPAVIVGLAELAVDSAAAMPGESLLQKLTAAPTSKDAARQRGEWLGQVFVDAYRLNGIADERWDAAASAFLRDAGFWLADNKASGLAEQAAELQRLNCRDPLVQYVIIRVQSATAAEERMRRMQRLLGNLSRRYSDLIVYWAKMHVWTLANELAIGGLGNAMVPELREHLVAAAADPVFAGANGRHYVWSVWGNQQFGRAGIDMVNEEMTAEIRRLPGVDPWLAQVVTGLCLVGKLRHDKGTPTELEQFARIATEQLTKAHAAHPERPEAAVGMTLLAMLQPAGEGDSPRQWFERAVAAQFDFVPAYDAMFEALRPARGGSWLAMRDFALECLASKRFDTVVPLQMAEGLWRIQREVATPRAVWASPGVQELLTDLWAGYAEHPESPFPKRSLEEAACLFAWAGGRYEAALSAYEQLGGELSKFWLGWVGAEGLDTVELDLAATKKRRDR